MWVLKIYPITIMRQLLFLIVSIISWSSILFSCYHIDEGDIYSPEEIMGLRPIYDQSEAALLITVDPPGSLQEPGRIYTRGSNLYINEKNMGIHVLDNTDPRSPVYKSFISIPGNVNIAIKDDVFYANNHCDLVALKIVEDTVIVLQRLKNVFPSYNEPESFGVYFECVDDSKGLVVGWEEALLKRPQCYK